MLRKLSMIAAMMLVCLPPGIVLDVSLPVTRADHGPVVAPPALLLPGPCDLMVICGCLTVLCLLDVRRRMTSSR